MKKNGIILECAHCKKDVYKTPSAMKKVKNGNVFCNKSCAASYNNAHYKLGENNPNYAGGQYKGSNYANKAFRHYLHKCAVCGLEEECCLQVHHIDEDRTNSDIENLIILCANCHLKVHNNIINLKDIDTQA